MVQQLSMPGAKSAHVLSAEVGIPQGTLSRWLRETRRMGTTDKATIPTNWGQEKAMSKRPEDWTFEEKIRVVMEAANLQGEALGSFLRKEGLHESQLLQWRKAMEEALAEGQKSFKKKKAQEAKQIRKLQKELNRKEKALAETAALLVLQKKAQALWGDEDDDTMENNEK